jgi:hypothetical protein
MGTSEVGVVVRDRVVRAVADADEAHKEASVRWLFLLEVSSAPDDAGVVVLDDVLLLLLLLLFFGLAMASLSLSLSQSGPATSRWRTRNVCKATSESHQPDPSTKFAAARLISFMKRRPASC